MVRRRSQPWIYQWSRPIIGAIAILGFCLTTYLTLTRLLGGEVACGVDAAATGCGDVLSSPYATVFGLPLSLFGAIAYLAMAGFALVPLTINLETNKKLRNKLEEWTWLFLLMGATAMTIFSGYLMYILFAKIGGLCIYCITSATFSLSFLVLVLLGRLWDDIGEILLTGFVVAIITVVGTIGLYSNIEQNLQASIPVYNEAGIEIIPLAPAKSPQPPSGWDITTTSGPAEISLAEHLTEIGAIKYGAYWCPHCYEQKQLFGPEAFSKINYIECAEGGKDPQPDLCTAANLEGFPTWDINGERYSGTQSLQKLSEASDYQGSTDFKYALPR
ncbi:MAG: vitamin K epoxide reductase family protein [Limnothrix sp. RL_2_0]|nr:vitamin K epoxide reductase family protein [Limnothrix sp. RL_2_0]